MTVPVLLTAAGLAAAGAGAAAVLVGWLRRRWLVVTVRGHSMMPTYQPGDLLLARRCRLADLRSGDVVVFDWPYAPPAPVNRRLRSREWVVKRVAALPGDPVPAQVAPAAAGIIPSGSLVVLGDNGGQDSRHFGLLEAERLLAVVVRQIGTAGTRPGGAGGNGAGGNGAGGNGAGGNGAGPGLGSDPGPELAGPDEQVHEIVGHHHQDRGHAGFRRRGGPGR